MTTRCDRARWKPREAWERPALSYVDERFGYAQHLYRPEDDQECPPEARVDLMAYTPNSRVVIEHTLMNFATVEEPGLFKLYAEVGQIIQQYVQDDRVSLLVHPEAVRGRAALDDRDWREVGQRAAAVAQALPEATEARLSIGHVCWKGHEITVGLDSGPQVTPVSPPSSDNKAHFKKDAERIIDKKLPKLFNAARHYKARPLLVLEWANCAYDPVRGPAEHVTKLLAAQNPQPGFHAIVVGTFQKDWPPYIIWDDKGSTLDPRDRDRFRWARDRMKDKMKQEE